MIPDLKKLDNFPICILSDKLAIIPKAVAIKTIGNINNVIVFAINTTEKIINGWIKVTEATFPRSGH